MSGAGEAKVSVIVDFGEEEAADSGLVALELDDTLNVDEEGETKNRFYPGEPAYVILHYSDNLRFVSAAVSAGSVENLGEVVRSDSAEVAFDSTDDTQETAKNPCSGASVVWYGRNGNISLSGREVKAASCPAIGEMSYSFAATSLKVTPPSLSLGEDEEYKIRLAVLMEEI